jgi:hypothetical protein
MPKPELGTEKVSSSLRLLISETLEVLWISAKAAADFFLPLRHFLIGLQTV